MPILLTQCSFLVLDCLKSESDMIPDKQLHKVQKCVCDLRIAAKIHETPYVFGKRAKSLYIASTEKPLRSRKA